MIANSDLQFLGRAGINYLLSPGAETGRQGWGLFTTTFTSDVPTTITTGAANCTLIASTAVPLRGSQSLQFAVTTAAGSAGQGFISDVMTLDDADLARILSFAFDYRFVIGSLNVNGSGTSTQTVEVWVYNVGLAAWTQPAGFRGMNQTLGSAFFASTFQTDSSNTSSKNQYRVALIIKNAPAGVFTLQIDQAVVGPQTVQFGAPVTDWVAYTPTFTGFGTVATQTFWSRRVGDSVEIKGRFTSGTTTATEARITLPIGLTSDSSKVNGTLELVGKLDVNRSATTFFGSGTVLVEPLVNYLTFGLEASTVNGLSKQNGNTVLGTGEVASFYAKVPVLGWSSTVQMSNDTDTRVVAARYSFSGSHTTNDAFQSLPTPSVSFDTHGALNTSNGTFTVPVSGVYRAAAKIGFVANASGVRALQLLKNGSSVFTSLAQVANSGTEIANGAQGFTILSLNAGDTLQWQGYQNSGGTLSYSSTAAVQSITFERLSGPSSIAATETVAMTYTGTATGTLASGSTNFLATVPTKVFDTHNAYASGLFTVPVSGKYQVSAQLHINATYVAGISTVRCEIRQAGSATTAIIGGQSWPSGASANPTRPNASIILNCIAGDTIGIYGGSDASALSYGAQCSLSIVRVGN